MSKNRITKAAAEEVAEKLTFHYLEKIETLENKRDKVLVCWVLKNIPEAVKALARCDESSEYIKECSTFTFIGPGGASLFRFSAFKNFPAKSTYHEKVAVTEDEAHFLKSINSEITRLVKERSEVLEELTGVLYSLRSYKSIIDNLPEAEKFLPEDKPKSEALVNLAKLRSKLK